MLKKQFILLTDYYTSYKLKFFCRGQSNQWSIHPRLFILSIFLFFINASDKAALSRQALSSNTQSAKTPVNIKGQVTDFFGNPLPEVSIEMTNSTVLGVTKTGKQGEYLFASVSAGKSTLVFKANGFYQERLEVETNDRESLQIDIGLRVGYMTPAPKLDVSGLVTHQDFTPASNAKITLMNVFNVRYSKTTYTDRNGKYVVKLNDPGQYIVLASKPGFSSNTTIIDTLNKHQVDMILKVRDVR